MNRTLCLKILYGVILISLATIVYWSISNTNKDYRLVTSLFIGLLLLIPGRISQYFYQDFYTGRKYMNKNDLDKALYHFLQFERCIEEKPWKKTILWMTWSVYTIDILAMVKHNISCIYINKKQYEEAEKYIKEALNIDKSIKLGMNNSKVDKIIKNMQSVYANIQSVE